MFKLFSSLDLLDEAVPSTDLDFGERHPDWLEFVGNLAPSSSMIYKTRVSEFVKWIVMNSLNEGPEQKSDEALLKLYLTELSNLKKANSGEHVFARTRFRQMASVFYNFWTYTGTHFSL